MRIEGQAGSEAAALFLQITIGAGLLLASILVSSLAFWAFEILLLRSHNWLIREPHRPKLALVLAVAAVWVLGMVTAGVWIWAITLRELGIFVTLEASVYFSLVSFTTLGYGDILLPHEWRLLGGMAAVTGLLNIGLLTAMLIEVLRHIRISQNEYRRKAH